MESARHHVTELRDLDAFEAAARPRFEADEAKCTIALTILAGLRSGAYAEARLYRVDDADGAPVAFGMRTPPFPLVVAVGERAPLKALGAFVASTDPSNPGVTGPKDAAHAFAEGAGRAVTEEKPMRLYVCRAVVPPARPPTGRAKRAEPDDLAHAVAFHDGFAEDVKMPLPASRPSMERAIRERRLFVWEDDGEIVSMTMRTPRTGKCTRIGLVYTPPKFRGRGYASGLVAHVTQVVLDEGDGGFVCLFTDLLNPTSNAIYQAVGYTPVSDYAELRF